MTTAKSTVRHLKAELEQVQQQYESVSAEANRLRELMAHLQGSIEHLESRIEEQETQLPAKTIRNEMLAIFLETRSPLHYTELLKQLESRGVEVKGKDPLRLVAAHLSNDERFKSVGGGVWGLASWPPSKFAKDKLINRADVNSAPSPNVSVVSLAERLRAGQSRVAPEPPYEAAPDFEEIRDEFYADEEVKQEPTGT